SRTCSTDTATTESSTTYHPPSLHDARPISALGRGVRSIERHIKARAGQPMRKLLRLQRAEQSFFDARDEFLAGRVVWSDVAARGGYADQAHFCREAREITGHSPHELARMLKSEDESYWIYRIWT
ncbi:helix-turn-helix domain-containing protein, partial [Duganella vulcania]|uniref:helix-turn-helix domain-containing protein n=1 Tax=Duganella vulcania TaxID=2692166 RepID=UPI0020C3FDBF